VFETCGVLRCANTSYGPGGPHPTYVTWGKKVKLEKLMKNALTLLVLTSTLFLQSCASVVFNPEKTTSSDYIEIHNNPKVGDYAIRTISLAEKPNKMKWEVLSVSSNGVLVKRSYLDNAELTLTNEFLLDRSGKVLKAWLFYDGKKYRQAIKSPPEAGSLENFTKVKSLPNNPYPTPAGIFKIDAVHTFTIRNDLGFMMVNSAMVNYLSNKVPFKIVERRSEFGIDPGMLLAALSTITYASESLIDKDYENLFNLDEHTGSAEGVQYEQLLEYGFGSEN